MIKGGALYYVLLLLLIISLIFGFILIVSYHENNLLEFNNKKREITRRVDSYILNSIGTHNNTTETSYPITLMPSEKIHCSLTKWGVLEIVKATGTWRAFTYSRCALLGYHDTNKENIALYMPVNSRGISLSGNSKIVGTCYLPDKSIRAASIEGRPFTGESLVHGEIIQSKKGLPGLRNSIFTSHQILGDLEAGSGVNFIESNGYISDSFNNSFFDKTILYYGKGAVVISDCLLSGNIAVLSDAEIVVGAASQLEDIILIAPKISIESGFSGSLQVFCNGLVEIGDNCNLLFPSLISMVGDSTENRDSQELYIGQNCKLHGAAVISGGQNNTLELGKGSTAYGQVYCDGKVTLGGDIYGSLYCTGFLFITPGTKYINHLLDNNIDYSKLSEYYCGFGLFDSGITQEILKWLN